MERIFKKYLLTSIIAFILTFISVKNYAQAPNISYSPSSNTLTLNAAFSISPTNTGGAVGALAYGTGASLSGATLINPWGMGIDPSGNIYVTNYNAGNYNASSISKYNSSGVYQGTFGTTANLQQPSGITFDASGNAYVLNYNRTNNGLGNDHGNAYVDQYNSSGVYQSTIIQGLGTANGIASDASSNLYVAQGSYNSGANTASQYNTSGALAFSIAAGQTANPVAVAVDGSYNIYVLDNTNGNVTKYNSSGAYVSTPIAGLSNPYAIYVDGAGDIYVGDSGTGTVTVYNPSGTVLTTITGLTDPRGIVTDNVGNLYVSDYTNNTLTKYPPIGGYFISAALPPGLSFSSLTGVISGTPTTPFSVTTYTVTAYNASGHSSTTITLDCPAIAAAPSISYNPSINVLTIGTAASLTPINSGGTTGITWSISPAFPTNGTFAFSTSTGIFSGTPSTKASAAVYTVTATNAYGSSSTKISIAFVVDNYWTGSHSNVWSFGNNWSAHHVPTSTELASVGVINYTGFDPTVTATTSVSYLTFGAANAATLTVNTGVTFTISNILTINTNATPIFTGSGTGSINVASAAVINVIGTGALTINSPLTFTLLSDATGSASIAEMTSGLVVGNVTVQRYIPGGTGYRGYILLTSPVNYGTADANGNSIYSINYLLNSTYITGTNFTTTTFSKPGNPSLYLYRENLPPSNATFTSGNYRGISNISASPYYTLNGDGSGFDIPVGNGYLMFFRGGTGTVNPYSTSSTPAPATLSATGKLNQGAITVHDWYTPASASLGYTTLSGDPTIEGFNLVGNPYACTIDLETYATGGISMTNLSNFVYELDPSTKNYGVYQLDGSNFSTNHASRYIVSGQGFFVMASSASPVPQITFNESSKVENIQNTSLNLLLGKPPVAANAIQYLRLQLKMDSVNSDETIIRFNNNAQNTYIFNEDAPYRVGTGKVSMSSLSSDNRSLAINQIPLTQKAETIALKVSAASDGIYTLNMNELKGIPQLYDIWLMDAYKKDSLDMRNNPTYSFNVIKSDTNTYGSKRFSLVIRQNPAHAYRLLNFTAAKTTGNQVQLVWSTENEQNYTNFTVERSTDGGKTYTIIGGPASSGAGTYSLLDKTPSNQNLYRLKQEDINNNITYSKIIPIAYSALSNSLVINNINIYPNPASSIINLAIDKGSNTVTSYHIQITNSSGLIIKQTISAQPTWQASISDLLPGSYVIKVFNNKDQSAIGYTKFVKL